MTVTTRLVDTRMMGKAECCFVIKLCISLEHKLAVIQRSIVGVAITCGIFLDYQQKVVPQGSDAECFRHQYA